MDIATLVVWCYRLCVTTASWLMVVLGTLGSPWTRFACSFRMSWQLFTQRQVHFGAPWPLSFTAILRAKFGDHRSYRKIALEGHRYTAEEALQDGILDYIVKGKTVDILAKAEEVADRFSGNATMGAWGLIKVLNLCCSASFADWFDASWIYTAMPWLRCKKILDW
jgi:hypothetical protein